LSLLEFITKRKAKPAWIYRAEGVIWRVVPTNAEVFVGEDRNLETKAVSFFCINQKTGEVLWKGISFDERWWIGIEAVCSDRVLLHGFSKPDMPDHKRILALDLFTGRTVWSNDDMRFVLAGGDSVFASKDTVNGRMIFELDLQTGSVLRSLENDHEVLNAAKARMEILPNDEPEFPTPMGESFAGDEQTLSLVHRNCRSDDVVGPIEIVGRNDLIFFSCHEKGNMDGGLENVLKIVDRSNGDLIFAETLDHNLHNTVPDSFFLQGNMFYFVKDRSFLTALSIEDLKK
jgi:outer membrane protein assembly factor BamB